MIWPGDEFVQACRVCAKLSKRLCDRGLRPMATWPAALSIAVATAADDCTSWFMAAKPTVRCDGVAGLRGKSFDQIDFVRWAQSKLGRTNSTLGELRSLSCRPATVRKNRSQDNTDLVYPYLDTLVTGYPQETGYATPRSCVLPSISSGSTD